MNNEPVPESLRTPYDKDSEQFDITIRVGISGLAKITDLLAEHSIEHNVQKVAEAEESLDRYNPELVENIKIKSREGEIIEEAVVTDRKLRAFANSNGIDSMLASGFLNSVFRSMNTNDQRFNRITAQGFDSDQAFCKGIRASKIGDLQKILNSGGIHNVGQKKKEFFRLILDNLYEPNS